MADESKEFQIRITTPADASGARETKQELAGLEAQAEKTSASVEKATSGGGAGAGAAAALPAQRAQQAVAEAQITDEMLKQQIELGRQQALVAQLASAKLRIAGDTATADALQRESVILSRSVALQRQFNIEREEAVVIARQLVASEEARAAAQSVGSRLPGGQAGGILRGAGVGAGLAGAAGLGLLGGQQVYELIAHAADEELRLARELDKTTDSVVKQAKEWVALGRAATTDADIASLAEKAGAGIDQLTEKIKALKGEELGTGAKLQDLFTNAFQNFGGGEHDDTNKEKREQEIQQYERLQAAQVASARQAIEAGQASKDAFDGLKGGPPSEGIAHYDAELERLQSAQEDANLHTAEGIQLYRELAKQITEAEGHLRFFTSAQERAAADTARSAQQQQKQAEAEAKRAADEAKRAADRQKAHDETLAKINEEIALEQTRLTGNDDVVKSLEQQRDLREQIERLQKNGLSLEEATTKATELQNLKLDEQKAKQAAVAAAEQLKNRADDLAKSPQERAADRASERAQERRTRTAGAQLRDEAGRRDRGAYGQTAEDSRETAAAGRDRIDQQRESAFDKAFSKPAAAKPSEAAGKPDAAAGGGKLDGSADKLAAAADKLAAAADKINKQPAAKPGEGGNFSSLANAIDRLVSAWT